MKRNWNLFSRLLNTIKNFPICSSKAVWSLVWHWTSDARGLASKQKSSPILGIKLDGRIESLLRKTRGASRIESYWASNFIQQSQLWTRWLCPYDYRKANWKDPAPIRAWFGLFCNMVAKHRILESDIRNFDVTGFLISQIPTTVIVTSFEDHARAKKIQPSGWEWWSKLCSWMVKWSLRMWWLQAKPILRAETVTAILHQNRQ